jgi:hypothetical protein
MNMVMKLKNNNMENMIIKFSTKMRDEVFENTHIYPIDLKSYLKYINEIEKIDYVNFITINANLFEDDYLFKILIYGEIQSLKLSKLTKKDWENAINNSEENGKRKLIIFLCKFLKIDGFKMLLDTKPDTKNRILSEIKSYPIVLIHSGVDEDILAEIKQETEIEFDYKKINKNLIEQGAENFQTIDKVLSWM